MMMNTQWLCGFGGIYGLNMQPIISAAHDLQIETGWEFYEKVKAFETEALKHYNKNAGGCNESQKAKCKEMFGSNLEWACDNCEDKK